MNSQKYKNFKLKCGILNDELCLNASSGRGKQCSGTKQIGFWEQPRLSQNQRHKLKAPLNATLLCLSPITPPLHLIISKKRAQLSHYKDEQNAEYFYVITSDSGITIGKVGLKLKKVKNPCPTAHWTETLQMFFWGRKKSIIFFWACILAAKTTCTVQSRGSHIHVCKRLSKTTSSAADDGADPLKKAAMQIS